jgi:ABC-type transport system involved in multi-copper enzyme maturation permease subunit
VTRGSAARVRTLAAHEYRSAVRSRVLLLLIASMVLLSAGSITIASYDFNAELSDYEAYVREAKAAGAPIGPAPELFPLQLLRADIEYIQIIGAVLAIGLGYLSVARERTGNTLRLILTRPVRRRDLFAGRVLGATALIGTVLAATAVMSVVLIGLVGGQWPTSGELVRLVIAFAFALVYMLMFYALGSWLSARSRTLVNGLVVALVIWLSVVLVIPQIGDTMDPDNQVPGGLFAALRVDKPQEDRVLAKFGTYEKARTTIEETSLTKHFERFTFAVTGVKESYNGASLGVIIDEKRNDLIWMAVYTVLMSGLLWTGLRRESTTREES